ncbi:AbrB/MazE/SpoVT family DNA-binding domain-containing protein [Nanoarchaeota archaeon]
MKRKVNRVGQNTLTVSLPAGWARSKRIKPGDELDLIEKGNNLLISTSYKPTKKAITLHIPKNVIFLKRFLGVPYVRGYDTITIKFDNPTVGDKVVETTKVLMGFEIVDSSEKHCKLMNLASRMEQDFEILLSRLFAGSITLARDLLARIKRGHPIAALEEQEVSANRIAMFCRRAIHTGTTNSKVFLPSSVYNLVVHLEELTDLMRDIIRTVGKSKVTLNNKTISLFQTCISAQEVNYKIFNRLLKGTDTLKELNLYNEHKILRRKVSNELDFFKGNRINSYICAKLLGYMELSHHINEELFS